MQEIPLIDIVGALSDGDQSDADTVQQVENACRDIGFMYICGHGISPETIGRARAVIGDYFARPMREKLRDRISRGNYRGYIPFGFFTANIGGSDADNYEGYKLHFETNADDAICTACDLYGPNKWPDRPVSFRQAILDYWKACDTVVKPLRSPQPGFERDSVHVGDVSREVWRTNWPDTVPKSSEYDLGTLDD